MATDLVKQVVELNHLSFGNGDDYNSADRIRAGLEDGTLIVLTEPRRPSSARPVFAYIILRLDKRCVRIERVAVHPKHRNNGHGKNLIERARRWRDLNAPNYPLWTYVGIENLSSLNAHLHAGFSLEAIGRDWAYVMG